MKYLLRWGWCLGLVMMATAALAAEDFSKSLTPEQFAAAGLDKLSPEQLTKLNELIRAQQSGELAKAQAEAAAREQAAIAQAQADAAARQQAAIDQARAETAAKVKQETEAKVRAEVAAQKPTEQKKGERMSVLGRMKVLLTPGADIEYARVETQIVPPYRGFQPGTVLKLANGQSWQVVDGSYWVPKKYENKPRKVVIAPGVLGAFFLEIEDGGSPKVKLVSNGS